VAFFLLRHRKELPLSSNIVTKSDLLLRRPRGEIQLVLSVSLVSIVVVARHHSKHGSEHNTCFGDEASSLGTTRCSLPILREQVERGNVFLL